MFSELLLTTYLICGLCAGSLAAYAAFPTLPWPRFGVKHYSLLPYTLYYSIPWWHPIIHYLSSYGMFLTPIKNLYKKYIGDNIVIVYRH